MRAAAHGNGTLGIPKSVGAEFANATEDPSELPETMDESMAEGPTDAEKFAHHRKMAKRAASPAARMVHQKLMAHHKMKMGK
jgi:hypothetical protein